MKNYLNLKKITFNKLSIGQLSFNLGVFLISSVLPLSIVFLLISLILSISINKIKIISDKWNLTLLISFGLILLSSINSLIENFYNISIDNKLMIIFNVFKWLLLFILFPTFQIYLKSNLQRLTLIKYFIAGSIPIIISCILQYWFKFYGPFDFFYGLITWYNKPIVPGVDGVSGLFSNQNYTGFWLTIIWPFCLSFLVNEKKYKFKKILYFIYLNFIFYFIITTTSRSALLGIIISLPLVLGIKTLITTLLTITIIFFLIYYLNIYFGLFNLSNILIPNTLKVLLLKVLNGNLSDIRSFERIKIWSNTLNFISNKPILGFGAGLFPLIYLTIGNYNAQHSHNFILQIAFEYGIPTALILSTFTTFLLIKTANKIFNKKENYNHLNKSWFAASLIATTSQITDITFFDGKISIIIIILLAGLKSILDERIQEKCSNAPLQIS